MAIRRLRIPHHVRYHRGRRVHVREHRRVIATGAHYGGRKRGWHSGHSRGPMPAAQRKKISEALRRHHAGRRGVHTRRRISHSLRRHHASAAGRYTRRRISHSLRRHHLRHRHVSRAA